MNFQVVIDHFPTLLQGLFVTIHLIGFSLILGLVMAVPLALIRHLKVPLANQLIYSYTYFFRATPLLLQIYLIYYGVAQFEWIRDSFLWSFFKEAYLCAVLAFSLNTAAYTAEIIKGALDTMNKQEIEAAVTFGMTKRQIYRRIVLPNALRRCIPAYSNEVIFLFHSSAMASVITVTELTGAAYALYTKYYDPFGPFLTVAFMYLGLILLIIGFFKLLEKKYLAYLNNRPLQPVKTFGNPL